MEAEVSGRVLSGSEIHERKAGKKLSDLHHSKTCWKITYRNKDLPLRRHPDGPPAVCGTSAADSPLFGVAEAWQRRRLFLGQPCAAHGQGTIGGLGALGALSGQL